MTITLNYLSFVVGHLERSLDFYRTLGLPIPEDAHLNAAGEPEDHVEISVNGLRIAWETETLVRQGRLGAAFEASSPAEVDAACQRLQAAGFVVKAPPYDAFWGQRYATITDPDSHSVDVFAWLEKR